MSLSNHIRLTLRSLLLLGLLGASASTLVAAEDTRKNELGINLGFNRDFDNALAFADLVKRSRPWGSADTPFVPITNVDKLGWPKQDAGLFLHVSLQTNAQGDPVPGPCPLPVGTYKIVFKGKAREILPSEGTISNKRYDAATNTTRANWKLTTPAFNNVTMSFRGTQRKATAATNTGITNLQIFLPGLPDDGSETFNPEFLEFIRKFRVVRFMFWMETNLNPISNFSERTPPNFATQSRIVPISDRPDQAFRDTTSGVAFEYMVQLCNETQTDLWVNVPANANDDFIAKMLRVINRGNPELGFRGLDPERKLYVELANEIWNASPGFLSFDRIKLQSDAALQDPTHPINFDGNTDQFVAFFRFIAFRAKVISDLCRAEFGNAALMKRVRPILASQVGDGQATLSTGLRFLEEFFSVQRPNNPVPRFVNQIVYGGGGAPYVVGDTTTKNRFFNSIPQEEYEPDSRRDSILTIGYGLTNVAYEGGPSIADPVTGEQTRDDVSTRAFNADPRITDSILETHRLWSNVGGGLFVYFNSFGGAAFEFAPSPSNLDAPKLAAIDILAGQNKAKPTTGLPIPGKFLAGSNPDLINEGNFVNTETGDVFLRAETFLGNGQLFLPVFTSTNLRTDVALKLQVASTPGGSFDVFFNGNKIGSRVKVGAGSSLKTISIGTARTQRGLNVLRLRAVKGEVQIRNVTF